MTASPSGPAYQIRTARLLLRCWDPADAPLLQAAITESLDHLRAWMPWAVQEPEPVEAKAQRLRRFRAAFDLERDFAYGIFDPEETRVLGGCGLHPRLGRGTFEVGYWIHKDHVGLGYATEAAAALTRVAFEVDRAGRVEIHCDPENARSAAVPRKLGFTHEATLRRRGRTPDGQPRDTMIWTRFRDDHVRTPAAAAEVRAFDVLGRRLL